MRVTRRQDLKRICFKLEDRSPGQASISYTAKSSETDVIGKTCHRQTVNGREVDRRHMRNAVLDARFPTGTAACHASHFKGSEDLSFGSQTNVSLG